MALNRRNFLKISAAAVGGSIAASKSLKAAENEDVAFGNAYAMLNDCTLCIGCRGCQAACKESHVEEDGLGHTGPDPRYDMPYDINADNYTVIHLHKKDDKTWTFVRKSCLHCNEPSCESVCPVSAFKKENNGVVTYNKNACIGCRYCEVACPFNAPTFEWDEAFPRIQKCDFCNNIRLDKGEKPVCASVCPRGAIKFGKRADLIKEAKQRIKDNPNRYNPHLYGEKEIGGTSVMFLAPKDITFTDLGYKMYSEVPPIELHESIQHGMFKYWIPPVALYGALGLIAYYTGKKDKDSGDEIKREEGPDGK